MNRRIFIASETGPYAYVQTQRFNPYITCLYLEKKI